MVALSPLGDVVGSGGESRETREAATQFEVILDALDRSYVDKVSPKALLESAVDGMLATLDPYTEYERGREASDLVESVEGRYGGVGLVIARDARDEEDDRGDAVKKAGSKAGILVVDAYEDYAWESGLRPKDRLLSIKGRDVSFAPRPGDRGGERTLDEARDALRGAPGTGVDVAFSHPWERDAVRSTTLRRFAVRRKDVELAAVRATMRVL